MKFIKKSIKQKIFKASRGAVSIFLAILMVPFTTIAGSLINAARVNSAAGIFDQSMSNSAKSTLGNYDKFLKDRFGLISMSQKGDVTSTQSNINSTYSKYLKNNLMSLSNTYLSVNGNAQGVYPLADTNVLMSQILEFSKYNVPVKFVSDILPLDSLSDLINKAVPTNIKNIIKIGTSTVGLADNIVSMGEAFTALTDANNERNTAQGNYDTAYNEFESAVSSYLSKKDEMNRELAAIQSTIDSESGNSQTAASTISSSNEKISEKQKKIEQLNKDLEDEDLSDDEIEEIEKKIEDIEDEIEELEDNKSDAEKDKKTADSKVSSAQSNYNTKKAKYEQELATLKANVETKKSNYSSKIVTLKSKLINEQGKLGTLQSSIANTSNAVTNVVTTVATADNNSKKSDLSTQKENLSKELEKAKSEGNQKLVDSYTKQIQNIGEQERLLKNDNKYYDALKNGSKEALSGQVDDIKNYNKQIYETKCKLLDELKVKVDEYNTNNITSVNKSTYYVGLSGLLTATDISNAEKQICETIIKDSAWNLIKGVYKFFESLLSISVLWDPKCASNIDMDYYNDTYGGLPSTKNRDSYPLNYGESGDAELSAYFKELLGSVSAEDMDLLQSLNIIEAFQSILNNLEIAYKKSLELLDLTKLLDIGKNLKAIATAVTNVFDGMATMYQGVLNTFSSSGLAKKMLVSGYMSYMLSDRTTYGNSSLTGKSFNLRNQKSTFESQEGKLTSLSAFISALTKTFTGAPARCFVGAEKEYLLFHSNSEIVNQIATFMVLYAIRLVFNLPTIFTNSEVASMASAASAPTFGIGGPILYALYVFVEPLADTIVLVNGGKIPLIKTCVYLTPSGLTKLTEKIVSLGLSKSTLESNKEKLVEHMTGADNKEYNEMFKDSKDVKSDGILDMEYSNYMLLGLSFLPVDTLVSRFSDIVQMEACENIKNNGTYELTKFDLDCSYTYIRAEASFTMNEFISISGNINPREKIIYRGY